MGRRKKRYPNNLVILSEYRQWRKENPKGETAEITEVDCPKCSAPNLIDMDPGIYFKQDNGDLLMLGYCNGCRFSGYAKVYQKADKLKT